VPGQDYDNQCYDDYIQLYGNSSGYDNPSVILTIIKTDDGYAIKSFLEQ
jgi:hypothetical protein